MDQTLSAWLDYAMRPLEWAFGQAWVAPFFLFLPMLVAAAIMVVVARQRTAPFIGAAERCRDVLKQALGDDATPATQRSTFSEKFDTVLSVFNSTDVGAQPLNQAWRAFHESIVDETTTPIQSTGRPFAFFERVEPRQTFLVFWSNAFVGIGLVLTFIGLIVALRTAAHGMQGGVSQAQGALTALLVVSSAKFFTSVGGIIASLVLRFGEASLSKKTRALTREICELLERGLVYIPPQRLAAQQLDELREQTSQLKIFNQDIAFQIADRINAGVTAGVAQAFAPMAASISDLNESMMSVTTGIGQGAAKAIAEVSGDQLKTLSATLAQLSERLGGISAAVSSSGEDAARQIRDAGSDFREAASDIRAAFDQLTGQVGTLGGKLTEQGDEAARVQSEATERMIAGLEAAQARSATAMEDAVKALQAAAGQASETMKVAVSDEIRNGVEETGRTFKTVLEESGEGMRSAASGLAEAIGAASEKIEHASTGFVRTGEAARISASALEGVTSEAKAIAKSIDESATGFRAVSQPVASASQAINEAAARIARTLEAGRGAEDGVLKELSALATEIGKTQTAAERAWQDYRARFEGVDKALENTTLQLGQSLGASLGDFRKFAQEFDSQVAAAIGKLSGALGSLEEYAESLDEYADALTKKT